MAALAEGMAAPTQVASTVGANRVEVGDEAVQARRALAKSPDPIGVDRLQLVTRAETSAGVNVAGSDVFRHPATGGTLAARSQRVLPGTSTAATTAAR
jgi:hypothetical protein